MLIVCREYLLYGCDVRCGSQVYAKVVGFSCGRHILEQVLLVSKRHRVTNYSRFVVGEPCFDIDTNGQFGRIVSTAPRKPGVQQRVLFPSGAADVADCLPCSVCWSVP